MKAETKDLYIKAINNALDECNSESLLHLILIMLEDKDLNS